MFSKSPYKSKKIGLHIFSLRYQRVYLISEVDVNHVSIFG
jgi:hypothetical protein